MIRGISETREGDPMEWKDAYRVDNPPNMSEISAYIGSSLWDDQCTFIEESFHVQPLIQHSICSMAPGFNVKYKKSGRAICTLYPKQGYFDCLLVVGRKQEAAVEEVLPGFETTIVELYHQAKPLNGSRWLNISVTSQAILENLKELVEIRVKTK